MPGMSLENRVALLFATVHSELERRHQNLRSAARPLLDASAELAQDGLLLERIAEGRPWEPREAIERIDADILAFDRWIAATGRKAPDRLGPDLRRWSGDVESLRAKLDDVPQQPRM